MDTSDSFFLSRKNFVGTIIALVVIGIDMVVGLGFLWPVVALAGWGAGFALTPGGKQQHALESPARPSGAEELRDRLDSTAAILNSSKPDPAVRKAAASLRASLSSVIYKWDRLGGVPEQRIVIESIINDFLPRTVNAYLDVTDRRHPLAVAQTVDAIAILADEANRIQEAVAKDTLRELEDHTRALRLQFGRFPNPGYDYES